LIPVTCVLKLVNVIASVFPIGVAFSVRLAQHK
jgi:hypothetical protein